MNVKSSTVYTQLLLILFAVATLGVVDIYLDAHAFLSPLHLVVEIAIIVLGLIPALYLLKRWGIARKKAMDTEQHLQDYLNGLGTRIQKDFERWELTEVEKRTALFILKGYSHREIAAHCHRSEGTVRQQAVAVYRKSGFASRAEFAAHFLGKFLMPIPVQPKDRDQNPETIEQEWREPA